MRARRAGQHDEDADGQKLAEHEGIVDLGGIDGLLHVSDLSWTKKIRHPAEYVKKGQELDVVILNIDENVSEED